MTAEWKTGPGWPKDGIVPSALTEEAELSGSHQPARGAAIRHRFLPLPLEIL